MLVKKIVVHLVKNPTIMELCYKKLMNLYVMQIVVLLKK